jgi:hypothetical protein
MLAGDDNLIWKILKTQFESGLNRGRKMACAKIAAFPFFHSCGDLQEMWFGPTRFKGATKINPYAVYPWPRSRGAAQSAEKFATRQG